MSPDELRALAEALDKITPVMGLEELHHMETLDRAADYLRACADAQPVGWMHPDGRVVPTATMDQAYRDGGAMQSSLRDYTIPLYAAPPAGPRRDPLRGALKTVIYELAALIPNPDKTLVDDWPCENAADRQCLQIAYTTAREALHGIGGSDDAK